MVDPLGLGPLSREDAKVNLLWRQLHTHAFHIADDVLLKNMALRCSSTWDDSAAEVLRDALVLGIATPWAYRHTQGGLDEIG